MSCFVLPFSVADGPANMALDEAMLRGGGARRCGLPALLWSDGADPEPRVFPAAGRCLAPTPLAGVPIVRRPTGGGAIWHHHELTYAIAVPGFPPRPPQHRALSGSARGDRGTARRAAGSRPAAAATSPPRQIPAQSGHSSALQAGTGGYRRRRSRNWSGRQRRRGGAVLQHGSVLLAARPASPICSASAMSRKSRFQRRTGNSNCEDPLPRPGLARGGDRLAGPVARAGRSSGSGSTYRSPAWTEAR